MAIQLFQNKGKFFLILFFALSTVSLLINNQISGHLAISCQSPKAVVKFNRKFVKSDTVSHLYNDIAQYIAGMPIKKNNRLFALTSLSQWKTYCKKINEAWEKYYEKALYKVSAWTEKELPDINSKYKTIFYPFSGPDFLHVGKIFPKAEKYILVAYEPVGIPPDPKLIQKDSASYFYFVQRTLNDVIKLGYFITSDMSFDLRTKDVRGALPIIMIFCARTGYSILDIKPVEINKNGEIAYLKNFVDYPQDKRFNKGAEITVRLDSSFQEKKIYYFSEDISNKGFASNPVEKLFYQKMDTCITFVKSASYLMHTGNFSAIRETVFAKSNAILQDDSGIRFKFFDKKLWDIQLYGNYLFPQPQFKGLLEVDLKKAYQEGKPKTLDFSIGYLKIPNLLLATKKIKVAEK